MPDPTSTTLCSPWMRVFSDPSSVAVVGASDDEAKWGYWLARGALDGRARRDVWLVNHKTAVVQGQPAYQGIGHLPHAPELVIVCVPAGCIEGIIDEALACGVRGFLVITAGVPHQDRIRSRIREAGAQLIGPNSLGLYDASTELRLAWGHFTPGPLAVISQSGQLGLEIAGLGAQVGLGISRFASVGNQLDVNAADLLDELVDHEQTRLVGLYLESFADGARLIRTLRRLRRAGKHVLVLTTGASESSQQLAKSHTGSMTSAIDTIDAACRAAGAIRVATPSELVDIARYLSVSLPPRGNRVAIISDSGGQGGIAADLAASVGLSTPTLPQKLQSDIADLLPPSASVANPVDLAGAGEMDMSIYAAVSDKLLSAGEVDAVVLSGYFGQYGQDTPSIETSELAVVDHLGSSVRDTGRPLVVHSMSHASTAVDRMWQQNLPAFNRIELVIRALSAAHALAATPGRELPAVEPVDWRVEPGYWAARQALAGYGVTMPAARLVRCRGELTDISRALRAPYVLKAGWLAHKSEYGGIALGLADLTGLEAAFDTMNARLGPGEYVVEEQDERDDVVEMLIGAQRDRHFGPLISVGGGGTEAELWRDVRTEIAPVDLAAARAMIGRLQAVQLLGGWRGRARVDIESLSAMVVAVSDIIAGNPSIAECELNPVRVGVDGALAVDALITPT